jgi:hypothetical protein
LEIADRISRELSVRPIIIDAHAKVTYGRREVLTIDQQRDQQLSFCQSALKPNRQNI